MELLSAAADFVSDLGSSVSRAVGGSSSVASDAAKLASEDSFHSISEASMHEDETVYHSINEPESNVFSGGHQVQSSSAVTSRIDSFGLLRNDATTEASFGHYEQNDVLNHDDYIGDTSHMSTHMNDINPMAVDPGSAMETKVTEDVSKVSQIGPTEARVYRGIASDVASDFPSIQHHVDALSDNAVGSMLDSAYDNQYMFDELEQKSGSALSWSEKNDLVNFRSAYQDKYFGSEQVQYEKTLYDASRNDVANMWSSDLNLQQTVSKNTLAGLSYDELRGVQSGNFSSAQADAISAQRMGGFVRSGTVPDEVHSFLNNGDLRNAYVSDEIQDSIQSTFSDVSRGLTQTMAYGQQIAQNVYNYGTSTLRTARNVAIGTTVMGGAAYFGAKGYAEGRRK